MEIFTRYSQNWPKKLENLSKFIKNIQINRKIWSETWNTVYYDILLQEQYGSCSNTVYWAKNSIMHHPCKLHQMKYNYYHQPLLKEKLWVVLPEPCCQPLLSKSARKSCKWGTASCDGKKSEKYFHNVSIINHNSVTIIL